MSSFSINSESRKSAATAVSDVNINALNFWQSVFTIAVVVGVILEGAEHWEDIKHKRWKPVIPKIGFLILVIGLAGEWKFQSLIGQRDTQFRNDAISNLNKSAAELRNESQKAREEEDKLNIEIDLVGRLFIPRRVAVSIGPYGPSGRSFATLKPFAGTKVQIFVVPELEAVRLAADISGALQAAGWKPTLTVEQMSVAYKMPRGVRIGVPIKAEDLRHPEHGKLQEAMKIGAALSEYLSTGYLMDMNMNSTAGIDSGSFGFSLSGRPEIPPWWPTGFKPEEGTLCIFVGLKPVLSELSSKQWLESLTPKQRQSWEQWQMPWQQE
jgi:hypothetical protein